MARKMTALAGLLLMAALILLAVLLNRTGKLLEQADIPWRDVRGILVSETWTDGLNYTDGYDWAILRVRKDFTPPDSWTNTTATLQEINPAIPGQSRHYFAPSFYNNELLPAAFTAWLYIPHDDADPFGQRAWFAAMYDEDSGILALYRGHDLWGF